MTDITTLGPTLRAALASLLAAPGHALHRHRDGYRSTAQTSGGYTIRTLRVMDRLALIEFDDPDFPRTATLTFNGLQTARLLAAGGGKGVAA